MGQWAHLYNTTRWRKVRALQLMREPTCRRCAARGHITLASVCDHVEPHRGSPDLFWRGPFQSLCAACHSIDKQREELGVEPRRFIGLDGWPVD